MEGLIPQILSIHCFSVITNIGHDHMDLLGDSFAKIAFEKAGIIKKNKPVVIGEFTPETKTVFLNKAIENDSFIYFAQEKFRCALDNDYTPDKPRGFFSGESQHKRDNYWLYPAKRGLPGSEHSNSIYCS